MIIRIILFLFINFGALALGSLFTNQGVSSHWYMTLEKAPWTPPGWLFGVAWTTIMICFSVYMASLWTAVVNKKNTTFLFIIQFVLNTSWSFIFFHLQQTGFALIVITLLTLVIAYFTFKFGGLLKWKNVFILPYLFWLLIATSLNLYIYLKN
jgi:tryptophan-rich sensory protein